MPGKESRSPCGERGLKCNFLRFFQDFILSLPVRGAWVEIFQSTRTAWADDVAPRAGSVG